MSIFSKLGTASILAMALGCINPAFAQDRIVLGSSGKFTPVNGPVNLNQNGGDNIVGLIQFGPADNLTLTQTGNYNRAVFVQVGTTTNANVAQNGNGVNRAVGFQNSTNPVGFVNQNGDNNFGLLFQNTLSFANTDPDVIEDIVLSLLFGPETVPIGAEVARRVADRIAQDMLSEIRHAKLDESCLADPAAGASLAGPPPCSMTVKVYGRIGQEDAENRLGILPYETDSLSVGASATIDFNRWLTVGVSVDRTETDIDYPGVLGDAELDATTFGLVAQVRHGNAYASLSGSFGRASLDTSRAGRGGGQPAKGDTDGTLYALAGEAGYRFQVMQGLSITPYVDLTRSVAEFDGYSETGNLLLGQVVSDFDDDALTVGIGASGRFEMPNVASGLAITADLALKNRLDDEGVNRFNVVQPFFSGAPMATPLDRDDNSTWFEAGAAVEVNITDRLALGLSYDGSFGGDVESHAGTARVLFEF